MARSLVELPKRKTNTFLHPENKELVLAMITSGFAFTFWNTVNIRPSMLSDPGYQDQRVGIVRTMNITVLLILAMAAGLVALYKTDGYVPAVCMAATGVGLYTWTSFELNHTSGSDQSLTPQPPSQVETESVRAQSVLYAPAPQFTSSTLPPKRKREQV